MNKQNINLYKIYQNKSKINTHSGNNTTLVRLSKVMNFPNLINFTNKIENHIIGIHAYKFGKDILLENKNIFPKNLNFILIVGGTDLNIDINDPNKEPVIKQTIINAQCIICFNIFMYFIIMNKYHHCINIDKVKIIPQSVEKSLRLIPKSNYLKELIYDRIKIKEYNKVFIMVGNIRKVKNPFFLEDIFKNHLKNKGYILVLIGEIIDDLDENLLKDKWSDNFYYLGPIDKRFLPYVYSQANGLINTSDSEGMSSSILEAMCYHCPIYARNIDGNKAIINHQKTGFLFDTPIDFLNLIEQPTNDITKNAYEYVYNYHSKKKEIEAYSELFT